MSNDTDIIEALRAVVVVYKRDNPMRTADVHDPSCTCMRCAIDNAAAALTSRQTDEPEAGLVDAWKAIEAEADKYKGDVAPAFILGMNHAAGIVRTLKEPKPLTDTGAS